MEQSDKKAVLIRELYDYFLQENFQIISAEGIEGCKYPAPLHNDGYGDQENKRPEVFAYDPDHGCFVIGITRCERQELASDSSLTEYNVFLDQADPESKKPFRLYANMPFTLVSEFNSLIREYIHREYWFRIIVMGSQKINS